MDKDTGGPAFPQYVISNGGAHVEAAVKAAVEAEREACAKVCDRMEQQAEGTECCKWPTPADCAEAIRARGQA
jgi:hypothetical protein